MDWRDAAACRDQDPDLFFPLSTTSEAGMTQLREARTVCNRCLVLQACRTWALDSRPPVEGIWGGLTHEERATLKRRRRPRGTSARPPAPPPRVGEPARPAGGLRSGHLPSSRSSRGADAG